MTFFIACAVLLQDETAEETFKKLEEAYEKAKTVSVKVKLEGGTKREGQVGRESGRVSLLLKEGNKARLEIQEESMNESILFLSDGSKGREHGRDWNTPVPAGLKTALTRGFVRLGYIGALGLFDEMGNEKTAAQVDANKLIQVCDFKVEDERSRKWLSFTAKMFSIREEPLGTFRIRLAYDPSSFKLSKRIVLTKEGSKEGGVAGTGTIVETYEECLINERIADETFALPGAPGGSDRSAEETFKKIEGACEKARSLSVRFTRKITVGDSAVMEPGILLVKEGNKVFYEGSRIVGDTDLGATSCGSDGSRIGGGKPAPEDLGKEVILAFVRLGADEVEKIFVRHENDGLGGTKEFRVEGVRDEVKSGEHWLTYTVTPVAGTYKDKPYQVRLCYDSKTYRLLKRVRVLKRDKSKGLQDETMTESYEEFRLNGDIPDDKFTLPEE